MSVRPSEVEKHTALQTSLSKFEAYLMERRLMGIEESEEDYSACTAEVINEDDNLVEDLDEIRLEDLEAAPSQVR